MEIGAGFASWAKILLIFWPLFYQAHISRKFFAVYQKDKEMLLRKASWRGKFGLQGADFAVEGLKFTHEFIISGIREAFGVPSFLLKFFPKKVETTLK